MKRERVIAPLILIGTLIVAAGTAGAQGGSAARPPVRDVVLVHGAYADGSSYARVIPLLRARGLRVTAVQNPLTSLAADVAATRRALARVQGPVILVGHSSAGVVITEVGNDPKVVGLVYISAIAPDDGQSLRDAVKGYPATPGGAEQKPDAAGYLTLTRKGVDEDFVPDLSAAERALVFETQGDWNSAFLSEKVTSAAWKTKPSWFVIPDDRMVPRQSQVDAAKRANAITVTLHSGHVPMLSQPSAVASVIVDAATRAPSLVATRAGH